MSKKKTSNIIILAAAVLLLIFVVSFGKTTKQQPKVAFACGNPEVSEIIPGDNLVATFEEKEVPVPALAKTLDVSDVLGVSAQDHWIEIDLSEQKLKAWDGGSLFLETPVSTGLPWTPTPIGEFTIQYKSRAQKMEGGSGRYYYYLPNVPYVMFFGNSQIPWYKGYSLHGTYWHNDFGTRRSHGCVNLPTPIAEKLYHWTSPVDNPSQGTKVVIHD